MAQNEANAEQRARLTLRAWTTLFESLRSSCVTKAPLLSFELYEVCALDKRGVTGGYFDGPLAWRILLDRIEGDGERSEADKKFYSTALKWQETNRLTNGVSQQEYLKRAFAFDIFTKILSRQVFERHRKTVLNLTDNTTDDTTAEAILPEPTDVHVAGSRGGSVAQSVSCAA